MNKKGFSNVFFVFLFVTAFIFYIAPIHFKLNSEPVAPEGIGADALNLINSYDVVSDFKIYLDKSAETASCRALYDIGKNGGYLKNKCGEEKGYVKWDTNCNPLANLKQNYDEYFNSEFKKHIDFKTNYIYSFENGNFMGKTEDKIEKTSGNIKYYVNPSFSIKQKMDLNLYRDIAKKLNENTVCLSDKDPKDCIGDEGWEMEKEGKSVSFDIGTGVRCAVKEGDKFDEKEVKIRFVRDFTKKDLLANVDLLNEEQ